MKADIVARRYAQALFDLGRVRGQDALDLYAEALLALAGMVAESPELAKVLRAPVLSVAEKRGLVQKLLSTLGPGGAEAAVRDFCLLLADKERLFLLGDIAKAFSALLDQEKGIVRGNLMTAVPLNAKRQAAALATLEKQTSKKLVLRFEVAPDILGGIVLRVGDTVLDASLRAQLNSLRDTIKRGV